MRDPILPVDPLTGAVLPEPKEVDLGPDVPIGAEVQRLVREGVVDPAVADEFAAQVAQDLADMDDD